jgi:hypothetical protein
MMRSDALTRFAYASDSWLRVTFIVMLIVVSGVVEALLIQCAEAMMLLRWSRDVVRYDLRWAIQEKTQFMLKRRNPANRA